VIGKQDLDGWYPLPPAPVIPAPENKVSLFDISTDPNEKSDLSAQYPDVLNSLLARVEFYRKSAEKPWYPASDTNSDPKNFNGIWSPWET